MQSLSGDFGMTLWDRLETLNSSIIQSRVQLPIHRCVMNFCQADKYLTRTCIFDDVDVFKPHKISKRSAKQTRVHTFDAKLLFLTSVAWV